MQQEYDPNMNSVEAVQNALDKISSIDQSGYTLNSVLAVSDSAISLAKAFDQQKLELPLGG
ncbi:MAG: hypothetical protein ACKO8C_03095, partial [Candidatus Nanopelagicaceae bacterium]